ncbi:transglycosylase domain-containing protein [Bacillus sp. NPDC077027]|uniref:transglycosylase domain-containing protein n=1 Tax=Bacillus sp. NPDC077027 TaxID=3390548 RepID=UPI003D092563
MDTITSNKRIRMTMKTIRACFFIGMLAFLFAGTIFLTVILLAKWQGAPSVQVPQSTTIYAADGSKLGETNFGEKRYWVPLKKIAPHLQRASIAVEDKTFYHHHGFDMKRMAGAAIADIRAMAKVQGASTITQQYARNLYLDHDKTWKRKWNEAFYTIRLEQSYTKNEILEGYLNTIYYGHGAYGIEAASRLYFGKKASQLSIAEAAMLAGIPKGPSLYSPYVNEEKANARKNMILHLMKEQGMLSKKEATAAKQEKLTYRPIQKQLHAKQAPYFYDDVIRELKQTLRLTDEQIETYGLHIQTTLDPRLQRIAEETIKKTIKSASDIQVGFTAIHPKTGHVLALVGGKDYEKSPFNRVTQAQRQPGSTLKPLLYYAAIQNGFTPATVMQSEETVFDTDEYGGTYSPSNYHGYYANGGITMLQAIALSDNIYAVKTHLFLGIEQLVHVGKAFGIQSKLDAVPSLALGTSPVKPLEMTGAYGRLANGGHDVKPTFIQKVTDAKGNVLYEQDKKTQQVLDEKTAFVTSQMMTGMFNEQLNGYTSVTGRTIIKDLSRTYAGKSGTTGADSWMIGFSPHLVAGVWTGYDKDRTIDSVEETAYAKKIWANFMEEALEEQPVSSFMPPDGVKGIYINPKTGEIAGPGCESKVFTYFIEGTEPTGVCYGTEGDTSEQEPPPAQGPKKWWEKWLHR